MPLIPARYEVCEVCESVNYGIPADLQGNLQVLLSSVAIGEPKLGCLARFVVCEVYKHAAPNNVDRMRDVVIEGSPEFASLVVHKPPPVFLDGLGLVVFEGCQEMSIE